MVVAVVVVLVMGGGGRRVVRAARTSALWPHKAKQLRCSQRGCVSKALIGKKIVPICRADPPGAEACTGGDWLGSLLVRPTL